MLKQNHCDSTWKNAITAQKLKLDLSYKNITDAMLPKAKITPAQLNSWLAGMRSPRPSQRLYTPAVNSALAKAVKIPVKQLQELYDTSKTILAPLLEWQHRNQLQRTNLEFPYSKLASEVNLIAGTDFTPEQMSNILNPSRGSTQPLTKSIVQAIAYTLELPKEKSWQLYKSKKTITLDSYDPPKLIAKRAAIHTSEERSPWQSFVISRKDELGLTYRGIAEELSKLAPDIVPTFATIFRWLDKTKSPRPSLRIYTPEVNLALAKILKVEPSALSAAYTACETPLAPTSEAVVPLEVLLESLESARGSISNEVFTQAVRDMIKTVKTFTREAKPLTKHNINHYWKSINK